MLIDCTIIIPTYNRPNFLKRILNFYEKHMHSYKFNFVVIDSSSDENKELNEKIVKSLPQLGIKYYNHFLSSQNFFGKLAYGASKVETSYAVLCADDDFLIPKAIIQSMKYLETNLDYIAAGGYFIDFILNIKGDEPRSFQWELYPNALSQPRTLPDFYKYMVINSKSSTKRISQHFAYYFPSIYFVHKTNFLVLILNELVKYNTESAFCEVFFSILSVIYGKVRTLKILYGARQGKQISGVKDWDYYISHSEIGPHYISFRKGLIHHLMKVKQINVRKAKKVIDEGTLSYLRRYFGYIRLKKIDSYITLVKTRIFFLKFNWFLYKKISFEIPKVYLQFTSRYLLPERFRKEFEFLRDHILSFESSFREKKD